NLSQSVIATNFFSNNILQFITTGNYWDTVNDFKPLMHTWSLGVEEQYYIVFPLIILLISKTKTKLFTFLLLITVLSFIGFLLAKNDYFKFYTLPTRFFEIAAGGLVSIRCNKLKVHSMLGSISLFLLLVLIFFEIGL